MVQNKQVAAAQRISVSERVEIEVMVYSRESIDAIRQRVALKQSRNRTLLQRLKALKKSRQK